MRLGAHAQGSLNGTFHADAFTFDNNTRDCRLFRAPLHYHTEGAQNNTSGSWVSLGPLPAPGPAPGPAPPAAPVPPALPTMPATPTFPTPPRPNIMLFFGDDIVRQAWPR